MVSRDQMKQFMRDVVRCMEFDQDSGGGVRVGIVTYNWFGVIRLHLNAGTNKNDVITKINSLPTPTLGTNMAAGLAKLPQMFTSSQGDRCKVCNVAIVLSDGAQIQGNVFFWLDQLKPPPKYNIKFFTVRK